MKIVTIWNYEDYKQFMKDFFKSSPGQGRGQLKRLAENINVHPTLISQIVNGQKDFSNEQAISVAKFLELNEKETEYFFELLLFSKAGSHELKNYHKKRLKKLFQLGQAVQTRVGDAFELTEDDKLRFYSEWKYVAIWLACSVDDLKDEESIARRLNIPKREVSEVINFLLEKSLCERREDGLGMKIQKTHIPSDSPLVKNHHLNWRLKSLDFIRNVSENELAFTAPFSISHKDFAVIKNKLLEMIQEISKTVNDSDAELVACLNLDYFFVTSPDKRMPKV